VVNGLQVVERAGVQPTAAWESGLPLPPPREAGAGPEVTLGTKLEPLAEVPPQGVIGAGVVQASVAPAGAGHPVVQGSVSARLPLPEVLPVEGRIEAPLDAAAPVPASWRGLGSADGQPYTSEGYVTLAVDPAQAELQARLQQRVKAACPEAGAVEVLISAEGDVQVRLRVASPFDGERLARRIRSMQDLAAYHPSLDIQVAR
jgi:hypothetical protein